MSSSSETRLAWSPPIITMTLLILLSLLVVGQMYSALALTDAIAADFAVAPAEVTSATTAFGIVYAFAFLIAGPLSDKYGPRVVITVGLLICAVTTALVAVAPTLAAMVALRAAQGASAAALAPAAFSYIAQHVEPARRALILTSVTSAMLSSAIIMQIVLAPLGEMLGWRGSFLAVAIAISVFALLTRLAFLPGPRNVNATLSRTAKVLPKILSRGELLALYAATVSVMTAFVGLYTALVLAGPSYLADASVLLFLRTTALPAFVIIAVCAPLLARISSTLRIPGTILLAAISLAMTSATDSQPMLLGVAQFVFVAAIAAAAPAIVQRVSSLVQDNPGTAVALYACSMFIGASLGPQLVRAFLPGGFSTIMLMLAAVLVIGASAALLATRLGQSKQLS